MLSTPGLEPGASGLKGRYSTNWVMCPRVSLVGIEPTTKLLWAVYSTTELQACRIGVVGIEPTHLMSKNNVLPLDDTPNIVK